MGPPVATSSNRKYWNDSKEANHEKESNQIVAGVILKMNLENFMCHSSLTIKPNKNLNFLVGTNGSGKSSILHGLVLGLLSDAKQTKRYARLQNFVKKDCSKAVIEVTLRNEGEDAYKPHIYGKSITFQRTLYSSGGQAFLLKDENSKVVKKQTKNAKEEGKRILSCFNINVDNPIAILQQEEAKEFLKVEQPDKLYDFFVRGTMLKECHENYLEASVQYQVAKRNVEEIETLSLIHI